MLKQNNSAFNGKFAIELLLNGIVFVGLWVLVFPVVHSTAAVTNKKTFTTFRNVFACQLVS